MTFREFLKERNLNDLVIVEDKDLNITYDKEYFGGWTSAEYWLDGDTGDDKTYDREVTGYYYCYNRKLKQNMYKVNLW